MKTNKYDVIIIGGGLGGLTCGCYLSKAGLKVLVIEKNEKAGGYCTYFERNGTSFEAGPHYIGSCSSRGILGVYFKELGLNKIILIKPSYLARMVFPGKIFEIPNDYSKYITFLNDQFPCARIESFFYNLCKVRLLPFKNKTVKKLKAIAFSDLLDSYFRNNTLKSIIASQWWFLGLPPKQISAYHMSVMLSSYLKDGLYVIKGGSRQITNGLTSALMRYNGELLLKASVEKVCIKNKKISGVILNDQREFKSEIIVSGIDLRYLFNNLIGKKNVSSVYLKYVNTAHTTPSVFVTYVTVKYDNMDRLSSIEGWYYSSYDHDSAVMDFYYISVPTLYDKSGYRKDEHVIIIGCFDRTYCMTDLAWKKHKILAEEINLNRIRNKISNIDKYIISKESSSPRTYEFYTNNYRGAIYGLGMSPKQIRENNYIFNNHGIKNIFFVGHWSEAGGGVVPVMISGKKIAKEIITDIGANNI